MGDGNVITPIEKDRPPAGTACARCKALGHFCSATEYIDDTDEAQCHSCLEAEDCPVIAAKHSDSNDPCAVPRFPAEERIEINKQTVRDYIFEGLTEKQIIHMTGMSPAFVSSVAADIKRESDAMDSAVIAEEAPRAILAPKKPVPQLPAPIKREPPDKRKTSKWNPIIDQLLRLKVDESLDLATPSGDTPTHYANNLRSYLHTGNRTCNDEWSIQQFGLPEGMIRVRRGERRPTIYETLQQEAREEQELASRTKEPPTTPKHELTVAHPVTIVTVPGKPSKEDMPPTLSRAFEMVIAEINADIERLEDHADDQEDEELQNCLAHEKELVGTLHDYHPAMMGSTATGIKPSVYERAMERAEEELRIIELEIARLQKRRDALKPVYAALKAAHEAERETR